MNKKIGFAVLGTMMVLLSSTLMASPSKKKIDLELSEQNPDAVSGAPGMVWRFIPNIGWRKFSPEGAQFYDWKEWEKTSRPIWFRGR